jgi:hypothetical protein
MAVRFIQVLRIVWVNWVMRLALAFAALRLRIARGARIIINFSIVACVRL